MLTNWRTASLREKLWHRHASRSRGDGLGRLDVRAGLLDDRREGVRVGDGDFAEHLAVEHDARHLECGDEPAVADAVGLQGRADPRDPELAEGALLLLAVLGRVSAGTADGILGDAVVLAAGSDEPLGLLEEALALPGLLWPACDAWHGGCPGLVELEA